MRIPKQRTRIVILAIVLIVTVVTAFSYVSLEKVQKILIDKSFSNLTTSRDIKKQQVKDFFAQKTIDIEAVSRSSDIALLLSDLNSSKTDIEFNNKYFLANYTKKHGYVEMFIFSAQNENILYHQKKSQHIKSSMENNDFKKNRLHQLWTKTVKFKRTVFLDMKHSEKEGGQPSLLMGTPIYIDKNLQ